MDMNCERRRVSFVRVKRVRILSQMRRRNFNKRRKHEEWMIGCNATHIGSGNTVTYYISRGDVKNTVFAYKHYVSDGKILVKHYLRNVSVVDGTAIGRLDLGNDDGANDDVSDGDVGNVGDVGDFVDYDTESTTDYSDDEIRPVVSTSSRPVASTSRRSVASTSRRHSNDRK